MAAIRSSSECKTHSAEVTNVAITTQVAPNSAPEVLTGLFHVFPHLAHRENEPAGDLRHVFPHLYDEAVIPAQPTVSKVDAGQKDTGAFWIPTLEEDGGGEDAFTWVEDSSSFSDFMQRRHLENQTPPQIVKIAPKAPPKVQPWLLPRASKRKSKTAKSRQAATVPKEAPKDKTSTGSDTPVNLVPGDSARIPVLATETITVMHPVFDEACEIPPAPLEHILPEPQRVSLPGRIEPTYGDGDVTIDMFAEDIVDNSEVDEALAALADLLKDLQTLAPLSDTPETTSSPGLSDSTKYFTAPEEIVPAFNDSKPEEQYCQDSKHTEEAADAAEAAEAMEAMDGLLDDVLTATSLAVEDNAKDSIAAGHDTSLETLNINLESSELSTMPSHTAAEAKSVETRAVEVSEASNNTVTTETPTASDPAPKKPLTSKTMPWFKDGPNKRTFNKYKPPKPTMTWDNKLGTGSITAASEVPTITHTKLAATAELPPQKTQAQPLETPAPEPAVAQIGGANAWIRVAIRVAPAPGSAAMPPATGPELAHKATKEDLPALGASVAAPKPSKRKQRKAPVKAKTPPAPVFDEERENKENVSVDEVQHISNKEMAAALGKFKAGGKVRRG